MNKREDEVTKVRAHEYENEMAVDETISVAVEKKMPNFSEIPICTTLAAVVMALLASPVGS